MKRLIYTRADTDYHKFDLGVSGDIVAHFIQPYFQKGHIVFTDNWYTSPILAEFLHEKETGICGTVRTTAANCFSRMLSQRELIKYIK